MKSLSFSVYPRPDTAYQAKSSTDYQLSKSNIYQRFYPRGKKVDIYAWLIFAIIGVIMGIMAFLVDVIVEKLVEWKWEFTQNLLDDGNVWGGGFLYIFISVLYSLIAALLTVYVGPGAMGSGIAELMGYFNGIHIP